MIRQLRSGERSPSGMPRRYLNKSNGYVRLRWRIGKGEYVEVYEHRLGLDGVVVDAPQVHHRNRVRTDNRPENLVPVDPAEHGEHHRQVDHDWIVCEYLHGENMSDIARELGINSATVSRILTQRGVQRHRVAIRRDIDRDAIAARIRAGEPIGRIARDVGCAHSVIDNIREDIGAPRRRTGYPWGWV